MNYGIMRGNVLNEITTSLRKPRQTQIVKSNKIWRDSKTYDPYTFPDCKCYQLVYDKRIIVPTNFKTFP